MKARAYLFAALLLSIASQLSSQIINEYAFPALPLKHTSAEIISGSETFVVQGMNFDQWFNPSFDMGGGMYIPFFLRWDGNHTSMPILLPDTGTEQIYAFDSQIDLFKFSSLLMRDSIICEMWSTVRSHRSDVPPLYLSMPEHNYAFASQSTFTKVSRDSGCLNPSIAVDKKNTVHVVGEQVSPVMNSPAQKLFSKYSSEIKYRMMDHQGNGYQSFETVGKGFYPEIKIRNDVPYILWFAGDSSTSPVFYMRVKNGSALGQPPLINYPVKQLNYIWGYSQLASQKPLVESLSWEVDTSKNVHAVWLSKIGETNLTVIHSSAGKEIFVDTSKKIITAGVKTRFMPNGEVRIVCISSDGMLHYFVSTYGNVITEKKSVDVKSSNAVLDDYIVDRRGNEHALVQNVNGLSGLYVIKYIGTDSAKTILLSKEYVAGRSSFVDSTNTVWVTGSRDSTHVLLSFNLDAVERLADFVFPLRVGNEWHYLVYPEPPMGWPDADVQKVSCDTTMPNGKTYFKIISKFMPPRFYRKDGLQVFQYQPNDSTERIRFDFAKGIGDTIYHDPAHSRLTITINSINPTSPLNPESRVFQFFGTVPSGWNDDITKVTDSIGITYMSAVGPTWELVGAKVDGRTYGTLLSVDEKHFKTPATFSLSQNYPNPFNPSTTFEYQLPVSTMVSLKIYDVLGREVAALVNEEKSAGAFKAVWNAKNFSSGIYFARMTVKNFSDIKKMILMK